MLGIVAHCSGRAWLKVVSAPKPMTRAVISKPCSWTGSLRAPGQLVGLEGVGGALVLLAREQRPQHQQLRHDAARRPGVHRAAAQGGMQ
jgi:hypothetical protein